MTVPVERALISLSDKTGLDALAAGLARHNIELVSTGGTATRLRARSRRAYGKHADHERRDGPPLHGLGTSSGLGGAPEAGGEGAAEVGGAGEGAAFAGAGAEPARFGTGWPRSGWAGTGAGSASLAGAPGWPGALGVAGSAGSASG